DVERRTAGRSGQGLEVAAAEAGDERGEAGGGEDLDGVAPLVEVPGHLEPARGGEADDEAAVGRVLEALAGVEEEAARGRGRRRREAPDDLAVAGLVLVGAEGASGMG